MRSVAVVLPASMWAMIPMLRVFARLNLRGIFGFALRRSSCTNRADIWTALGLAAGVKKGPRGLRNDADVATGGSFQFCSVSIRQVYFPDRGARLRGLSGAAEEYSKAPEQNSAHP